MLRLGLKVLIAIFLLPATALYAAYLHLVPDERERSQRKLNASVAIGSVVIHPVQEKHQEASRVAASGEMQV